MFSSGGLPGPRPVGAVDAIAPVIAVQRAQRPAAAATDGMESDQTSTLPGASMRSRQAAQAYGSDIAKPALETIRRVDELMSTSVFALHGATGVAAAMASLEASGHAQAPVLGNDGALLGLFVPPLFGFAAGTGADTPVSEVMITPVEPATLGTDIRAVARLLVASHLPGLPVVDAAGRICGFIGRSDIVRAVGQDPPLDLWI